MEFDGSFGLAEKSPVKEADRQIDESRIQAEELIFEAELLLSDSLALEASEKQEEHFLEELPRAVFVGIGQGGVTGGGDAEVFQFTLTSAQAAGDFPEGMGSAQLAEEHGHKLSPAGEASSMAFGTGFLNDLIKFISGKEL